MKEFSITTSSLKKYSEISILDTNEYRDYSTTEILGYAFLNNPFHQSNINEVNSLKKYGEGVSICKVNIFNFGKNLSDLVLSPYLSDTNKYREKYRHLDIHIRLNSDIFNKIQLEALSGDKSVKISFSYSDEGLPSEDPKDTSIQCEIKAIKIINSNGPLQFIKCKTEELRFLLQNEHCLTYEGTQASRICNEFAESLAQLDTQKETDEHLSRVDEFLKNLRSTLGHSPSEKITSIQKELKINDKSYLSNDDMHALKERIRGDREAEREFDLLWKRDYSSKIFSNGIPFDEYQIKSLASEYSQLCVSSKCCEDLLIQLLTYSQIGIVAGPAQYSGGISREALLTLPYPIYDKVKIEANKPLKEFLLTKLVTVLVYLICFIAFGFFDWWVTGLVAGTNQTAHLILFGIMLLAPIYSSRSSIEKLYGTNNKIEQRHYENLVLMCNLYEQCDVKDIGLLRAMLYNIEIRGVKYPGELYALLSQIESSKAITK